MRRELQALLGSLASWGRREKRVMQAMPLEEAGGSLAPQGSLGPLGQREKLVSMARLGPQDSKETRGSQEPLGNRDQLAPRALRVNPARERWWITMETSTRHFRRSGHWP